MAQGSIAVEHHPLGEEEQLDNGGDVLTKGGGEEKIGEKEETKAERHEEKEPAKKNVAEDNSSPVLEMARAWREYVAKDEVMAQADRLTLSTEYRKWVKDTSVEAQLAADTWKEYVATNDAFAKWTKATVVKKRKRANNKRPGKDAKGATIECAVDPLAELAAETDVVYRDKFIASKTADMGEAATSSADANGGAADVSGGAGGAGSAAEPSAIEALRRSLDRRAEARRRQGAPGGAHGKAPSWGGGGAQAGTPDASNKSDAAFKDRTAYAEPPHKRPRNGSDVSAPHRKPSPPRRWGAPGGGGGRPVSCHVDGNGRRRSRTCTRGCRGRRGGQPAGPRMGFGRRRCRSMSRGSRCSYSTASDYSSSGSYSSDNTSGSYSPQRPSARRPSPPRRGGPHPCRGGGGGRRRSQNPTRGGLGRRCGQPRIRRGQSGGRGGQRSQHQGFGAHGGSMPTARRR